MGERCKTQCVDFIQKVVEEMQGKRQQNIEITPKKSKEYFIKWRTGSTLDLMVFMAFR